MAGEGTTPLWVGQPLRDRAEALRLPAPPGTEVWSTAGTTKVVAEDGSLRDADEAER
jgi:hypothetical protein